MTPRSTTITESGRGIRRRLVLLAATFLGLVALGLVARLLDRSTQVDGPAGSSYVTTAMGSAALFEVLEALGGSPERLRRPLTAGQLEGVESYLVLDPGFTTYGEGEVSALDHFTRAGGTVVIAGVPPQRLAAVLLESPPRWSPAVVGTAERTGPGVDVPAPVVAGRFGAFHDAGSARSLLAEGGRHLVLEEDRGAGRVVLVADVAVLSNEHLDAQANAELAVELAGLGRSLFDEYRHGFSEAGSGGILAALPGRWGAVAWLLLAVVPVALVSYGRRLAPAEPLGRELAPERRLFLESVSRTLRRTGDLDEATEPVRRAVRRRLAERSSLPLDAGDEELRAAARRAGIDPSELEAILVPGRDPDSVLAADRVLAGLEAGRSRGPEGGGAR